MSTKHWPNDGDERECPECADKHKQRYWAKTGDWVHHATYDGWKEEAEFDTWWRDHGALERLDQSHREAARAAFDAGRGSRHTGDCRRWRLVTGHRRVYQGSHACTCGASSQREEPPT